MKPHLLRSWTQTVPIPGVRSGLFRAFHRFWSERLVCDDHNSPRSTQTPIGCGKVSDASFRLTDNQPVCIVARNWEACRKHNRNRLQPTHSPCLPRRRDNAGMCSPVDGSPRPVQSQPIDRDPERRGSQKRQSIVADQNVRPRIANNRLCKWGGIFRHVQTTLDLGPGILHCRGHCRCPCGTRS